MCGNIHLIHIELKPGVLLNSGVLQLDKQVSPGAFFPTIPFREEKRTAMSSTALQGKEERESTHIHNRERERENIKEGAPMMTLGTM